MKALLLILFVSVTLSLTGQSIDERLETQLIEKNKIESELLVIDSKIETLRLNKCIQDLKALGLPSQDYIEHSAMILSYSEQHEQAAWVSHMIIPEIAHGTQSRTNDFRVDPKVTTGTAVEEDYFLKYLDSDGEYEYDGYGYDRGHLAPSADFSWSYEAISQSYFYSNMSPQHEDLNQGIWAELEAMLRDYVILNNTPLYIVTLPLLHDKLPEQERSVNGVSIPTRFVKVALDLTNNQGIAFLMDNRKADDLIPSYAITIDKAEELSGFDFFPNYKNEAVENKIKKESWFLALAQGDVEAIYAPSLPRGHFNTTNARGHADTGKKVTVCGRIVGTHVTKNGNLWLNLDKKFPNTIFSIFIPKRDLFNFEKDIDQIVMNEDYCFTGKVDIGKRDRVSMTIKHERHMKSYIRKASE